ncbi:NACHT domain-containing protein [Candidatus Thiosymbion oneisti]|uniref:NACHT domain-containing protein n=1 Tax=Candidatus Thiosymbion oneisti TaxID=589554 RepID=UPI000A645781|nr:leucine-rich repeat domain-containing protein [Candidatus Thiosymbion oneisti]
MTLLETLIIGIGTAVAKATLKLWLKDQEIADATIGAGAGELSGLLIKKIPDLLRRNDTETLFDQKIRDLAGDSIHKVLRQEAGDIAEERLGIIANAAAETLAHTPIDAKILVAHDLDDDALVEYFLSRTGAAGGNPALAGRDPDNHLFAAAEQRIYRRILSHASQLIVDMASHFPRFEERVNAELLRRVGDMAQQVVAGINRVVVDQADAFEGDYRNACVRRYDQLELFGVDLQETNKRYNLSIAYVTLMIERPHFRSGSGSGPGSEQIRDSVPADRALAAHRRLFIRGPAGSGKTTLLQWFAVFAAARRLDGNLEPCNECVPFLIKLRHFSETPLPRPKAFPHEASRALGGSAPANWVHDRLKSGKALVLVDGLDEASARQRQEVRAWLRDLIGVFPNARYVVTSRPHAAKEGWLDADEFVDAELQDMARSDIHAFIAHWHRAVAQGMPDEEEKAKVLALTDSLKAKLGKNAAIYRLATSPLLCALLCALHRQRVKNLPSDRIQLYRSCIDMFFRRDEEREVPATDYLDLSDRQKGSLLQDFAWWMIRNGKTTATPEEAVNRFGRAYQRLRGDKPGTGEDVMRLFLHRIGIIRELAHRKIDFPHRTFQEYLAAKGAIEEEDLDLLVQNAQDVQWREVVILATGLLPPKRAESLLQGLLARGDREPKDRHALYLVAVAGLEVLVATQDADSEIEQQIGERIEQILPPRDLTDARELAAAGDLAVPHLTDPRSMTVDQAAASIRALTLIGTEPAYDALGPYLDDERAGVQRQIIAAYEVAHDPNAYVKSTFERMTKIGFSSVPGLSDISMLGACAKLQSLNLQWTRVSDLSPLGACVNLQSLDLQWTQVSDLSPLGACSNLQSLDLSETKVSDLSTLGVCSNLQSLDLGGTPVRDVSDLGACAKLQSLDLRETQVRDLSALGTCAKLQSLDLSGTQVSDLSALGACSNLQSLDLRGTRVSDLSALGACAKLQSLDLRETQVRDVSALGTCANLQSLDLGRTQVSDLSALGACSNLQSLDLGRTQVSDVSDLGACSNLQSLDLRGTRVTRKQRADLMRRLPKLKIIS